MLISFLNSKFEKTFNSSQSLQKAFGKVCADIIRRRLDDLRAANVLEDVRNLPGKYHELTGKRKGQIATHVQQPYRLIFEPTVKPPPVKADGGLDWLVINSITIIEVVNYHD